MTVAVLDRLAVMPALSTEIAQLAAHVQRSVVVVRHGRGAGSGVIWRSDGLVLTNNHVVHNDEAEIVLHDGRRLAARVTRRDPEVDLATLTVSASDLPAATIGDSRALQPGQLVFAVGNPLGFRNSVVAGIVSATGPFAWPNGRASGRDMIQANLSLYPGNSGGALADAAGRVVGLPSMVMGAGRAVAVPAHVAEAFLASETATGARFGFAGAWVPLPSLPSGQGAGAGLLLFAIEPDSPAERAGLLPGDIVLGKAGALAQSEAELTRALAASVPGSPVSLRTIRAGAWRDQTVLPEARAA